MNKLIFFLVVILLFQSCKFQPDKISLPQWKSEWLGPLAKISLSPQDIKNIDSIAFGSTITATDLNLVPGVYPSLPAINNFSIQQTVKTSDIYYEITFDSAFAYITIKNQTPLTIKSGTVITLSKNSNTLLSFTLPNDLSPNTSYQSPEFDFAGKKLYNEVDIKVENLSTNPINNNVNITGNEQLSIQFRIRNLQLRELAVEFNNQFEIIDTTDFSFAGNEMAAEAVNGRLKIFIENQFPIQQNMQAYFTDTLFRVVDSLFIQPFVVTAANVDGQGYSIEKPLSTNEILLNPQKFENLKNAKFLIAKAKFQNINQSVSLIRMRRTDQFDIQVVGDLELKYDITKKEQ